MSEQVDYGQDQDWDEGYDCMTCLGDGSEECADPFQCFEPDCDGEFHTCPNCRGSGSAADMRCW